MRFKIKEESSLLMSEKTISIFMLDESVEVSQKVKEALVLIDLGQIPKAFDMIALLTS